MPLNRYSCSTFFTPFFGTILRLLCLPWFLQVTKLATGNFFLVLQKVALQFQFVVSPLTTDCSLFSEHIPCLPKCSLVIAYGSLHKDLTEGKEQLDLLRIWGALRFDRGIPRCGNPRGLLVDFLLMQSLYVIWNSFLTSSLLPPSSHGGPISVFWVLLKGNVFLQPRPTQIW